MPLLLSLLREIVFASREDKIPEFRAYADYLQQWGQGANEPAAETWRGNALKNACGSFGSGIGVMIRHAAFPAE